MEAGYDVVGAGAVAVDTLLFVDGTLGDGKGRVTRRVQRFGGTGAGALVAAARAGARTAFLGYLPDDTSGEGLPAVLRQEGIDLRHARMSAEIQPVRSTIVIDQVGQRFIAFDDDTAIGLPEDLDLELVRAARVLLLDGFGLVGGLRAVRAARTAGVAVVVDVERVDHALTPQLLDLADHLVLPAEFALDWTGQRSIDAALQALWRPDRAAVVITVGADGSRYRVGDEVRSQPAVPVTVVDTTGCGDVFHGSYAAALAAGRDVAGCVAAAAAAAAECATRPGVI